MPGIELTLYYQIITRDFRAPETASLAVRLFFDTLFYAYSRRDWENDVDCCTCFSGFVILHVQKESPVRGPDFLLHDH
jgi:hypothetical protein